MTLARLEREIVACRSCPRLVAWRERMAAEKVARFRDWQYWGKPVPGFGDPAARLLVVGLAPAAHGGNRTGRMFTGDRSGDWLYRALYRAGFASQPSSTHRGDGLALRDAWITAAVRCAPPDNKPTAEEETSCRAYLVREVALLRRLRVVVGLGKLAFDAAVDLMGDGGRPRPRFAHHAIVELPGGKTLLASYHPSQRNTSTKLLREEMLDAVFADARRRLTGSRRS